jgi:hypothetical protein
MRWFTVTGAAVRVGDTTVTPHARVLSIGGPTGGFAWQFPTGVRVERPGAVEWLPIVNVTLLAQVGLYALAVLAFGLGWLALGKDS